MWAWIGMVYAGQGLLVVLDEPELHEARADLGVVPGVEAYGDRVDDALLSGGELAEVEVRRCLGHGYASGRVGLGSPMTSRIPASA
jgi:hypothetical protein